MISPNENKINLFIAQTIAKNVDQLGAFIQNIMVDAYLQGYNDALEGSESIQAPTTPFVATYLHKLSGIEYTRGNDNLFYQPESGDLPGLDRSFLSSHPQEYAVNGVICKDLSYYEVGGYCRYQDETYAIQSFSEQPDGTLLVAIGPTITEHMDPSNAKQFKVVKVDEIS